MRAKTGWRRLAARQEPAEPVEALEAIDALLGHAFEARRPS